MQMPTGESHNLGVWKRAGVDPTLKDAKEGLQLPKMGVYQGRKISQSEGSSKAKDVFEGFNEALRKMPDWGVRRSPQSLDKQVNLQFTRSKKNITHIDGQQEKGSDNVNTKSILKKTNAVTRVIAKVNPFKTTKEVSLGLTEEKLELEDKKPYRFGTIKAPDKNTGEMVDKTYSYERKLMIDAKNRPVLSDYLDNLMSSGKSVTPNNLTDAFEKQLVKHYPDKFSDQRTAINFVKGTMTDVLSEFYVQVKNRQLSLSDAVNNFKDEFIKQLKAKNKNEVELDAETLKDILGEHIGGKSANVPEDFPADIFAQKKEEYAETNEVTSVIYTDEFIKDWENMTPALEKVMDNAAFKNLLQKCFT